ncbi:hypothetical protein VTK26DRAFT_5307 [Humicola hyalothermophila]
MNWPDGALKLSRSPLGAQSPRAGLKTDATEPRRVLWSVKSLDENAPGKPTNPQVDVAPLSAVDQPMTGWSHLIAGSRPRVLVSRFKTNATLWEDASMPNVVYTKQGQTSSFCMRVLAWTKSLSSMSANLNDVANPGQKRFLPRARQIPRPLLLSSRTGSLECPETCGPENPSRTKLESSFHIHTVPWPVLAR